ncbi:zinc finger protein [Saccharopolyspora flava]|uniref:zinc finger protein n=1 Tax=Saccharopolyspora flava TaxID=95161 RepID=UPI001114B9CD|nr:zinc finger protein [Saccharopolyspora flava]
MHPFRWTLAEGKRHATTDRRRLIGIFPVSEQIETLCGRSVEVAEPSELAWLWETCASCNESAHLLVASES